jgi:hypothetical protein
MSYGLDCREGGVYLTIVESPIDGKIMYICVENGGHLGFLDRGDAFMWMQYKHINILLSPQSVNRSATSAIIQLSMNIPPSIPTCSSQNSQMIPLHSRLPLILLHQKILKQIS